MTRTPRTLRLMTLEEPSPAPQGTPAFALWALGFRPFYFGAAVFAALSIALWALQFSGLLGQPYLAGPLWHAHEMVFGFALAVIVGFLFTAGRNWSNQPTPTGPALAALFALWLAGRVLVLTPWGWAAALANAAFPLAAAIALARPFWRARSTRNYFFVGLLLLLAAAALGLHLVQLGALQAPAWLGVWLALDVVLFIMAVMGGRVIPMFTNNGVPGAAARRHPLVERTALGALIALWLADAAGLSGAPLAGLLAIAALAHGARLALWQPHRTLRTPLVWVLHAAYAFIVLHLVLRALAALALVATSPANHALTVGAIGALTLGMMTRTAKGHTARPLRADGRDTACYGLVLLAALVRVAVPLAAPAATRDAVLVSALLWSAAYGLYALAYWPVLSRARLDGRPG